MSAQPNPYGLSATQATALAQQQSFALTAGAGSGKTHTLTALVARDLIEHDIPPEDILVCTFTRAAAANVTARIEERLRALAPERSGQATLRLMCGTIDAVGGRLVAERALDLGVPVSLSPGDERDLSVEQSHDEYLRRQSRAWGGGESTGFASGPRPGATLFNGEEPRWGRVFEPKVGGGSVGP